jgi:two-component system sensor histidine kinase YesM
MKAFRALLRITIARRFLLVFLLTIVIPIAAIGILLARINERILLRDASRRTLQSLEKVAYGIDEEAKRISLLAAALAHDVQFADYAAGYDQAQDSASRYAWSRRMEQHLDSFFNYSNKIGAVVVFFRNKAPFVYRNNWFLFERAPEKGDWFREVVREKSRTRILPDLSGHSISSVNNLPVLSVAVCPEEQVYRRGLEALVVSFKVSYFDQLLSGEGFRPGEDLYLLNSAGRVLLSSLAEGIPEADRETLPPEQLRGLPNGSVFRSEGSDRYLVSSIPLPFSSWRLLSRIDTARITQPIDTYLIMARYSIMAFFLLFVVFIILFFYEIVRPIHQVIATMKQVEKGNYQVSVSESGMAELAELGRAFNSMIGEVHRLTSEKEQKERERLRLEMEALRLRINPHFLTNTLSSIRLMAGMSKADSIVRMTGALMKVLNDCFRNEGGMTTVAQELEILENYVLIMKVRYGDSFEVVYDVDPAVRKLPVLRMILQPLVENSILHGLNGLGRKGEIRIRGRVEEGRLILRVADNGRGMSKERAQEALALEREEHSGFIRVGLRSVDSRIRLTHGEPYGLSIESRKDAYTRVTLCLPVLQDKERADVHRPGG